MQTTGLKGARLSLQQERLWPFLQESSAYCVQSAILLEGVLHEAVLLRNIQEVIERHEILQTVFYTLPGMEVPVQVFGQQPEVSCSLINLQDFHPSIQQTVLEAHFDLLQTQPFDLAHGPLLRTILFHLSPERYLLLVSASALCADAATLPRFISELLRRYEAELSDQLLDEEPLQYTAVSAWENELFESEEAGEAQDFWHQWDLQQATQLSLPFSTAQQKRYQLPTHTQLLPLQKHKIQKHKMAIDTPLTTQIQAVAERYQVSPEALLCACWQMALWRLTDNAELVIGVACDGRDDEELAEVLGPLTRFVPLGLSFGKQWTFEQVLASVSQLLQAASKWQHYFTWPASESQSNADNMGDYLPITFEYQNWSIPVAANALAISLYQSTGYTEPCVLKFHALQSAEHLQLEIHYDPHYISEEQIARLSMVYQTLLASALAQPQAEINTLPIVSLDEQKRLCLQYCAPREPLPAPGLHHLFEEQVYKQPQQVAVLDNVKQLTYAELNSQANQLARVLRRYGVGSDALVGLVLPRSVEMIVAMLAIFKAGCGYVPIDPESPAARMTYQLHDVQAPFLLTTQELLSSLPQWGGQALSMETLQQDAALEDTDNLALSSSPEDIAYVIYTSGSTGLPKGVMVHQGSVVNYSHALCAQLHTEPGWSFATVSTLAADLGNTAIFCALASGGCLHIPDYDTITSAEALVRWSGRTPIDVLKIVPSHLAALLADERAAGLLPRSALVLGGEALPLSLVQRIHALGCSCEVYNHYGPTESTIGVLTNNVDMSRYASTEDGHAAMAAIVPLGSPITNTEVYVLDEQLQIVPIGVVGELYIGGAGLASGYLHQPAQTATRFIPHPFVGTSHDQAGSHAEAGSYGAVADRTSDKSDAINHVATREYDHDNLLNCIIAPVGNGSPVPARPGARLYRTGDLVRYNAQGQIEFVGRRDSQVKLRGYRIELGEIEAMLKQHPNVWDGAVVLWAPPEATPQLVAYVVARKQPDPGPEQLSEFLRAALPTYMIPSIYIPLKVLPLTANGKLDRRQLPAPEAHQHEETRVLVPPRNPIEEMLLQLWQNLLGVPEISIHDNFFQIGGHSLLATQVISRVLSVMHVELPIQRIFEAPTIAGFAKCIEHALSGQQKDDTLALTAMPRPTNLPLSFAQQRLWFLEQLEPESTAYLLPRALRIRGALDLLALELSLQEMIQRHENLRTTFEERDGQPVQIIHPDSAFCLPVIDMQALDEKEREKEALKLAQEDAERPCNLAQGPLLRVHLLSLAQQEYFDSALLSAPTMNRGATCGNSVGAQSISEYVLLLTMHHIISDDWSNGVFVRELITLYRAFAAGEAPCLPPLPLQYADFAIWQRQWLREERLAAQLDYWKQQLAAAPVLELPIDHPRPPVQTFRGDYQAVLLPPALQERLIALSQKEHVTLFMLLLSAFQVLLSRYSGQSDICVGTPIANRTHVELEGLIGFFVNTLVMRTDLSDNPTFLTLLDRARKTALAAYVHQDIPFEHLVEALQPKRNLSHSPLFQVMFVMQQAQRATEESRERQELTISELSAGHRVSKFDLTLHVSNDVDGLHCGVEYNIDLFEAGTIQRLLGHWQRLLEGIAEAPVMAIAELPLLTDDERQQLFHDWNATGTEYPREYCFHELFARQAANTPSTIAVVGEEGSLTYQELDQRANQLAHYLRRLGVGPEVLVGVHAPRSLPWIIALLAILKAGGGYLPLDPAYPPERLAFMIADAHVAVVLTGQDLPLTCSTLPVQAIAFEQLWQESEQESRREPSRGVRIDNVAYVIYTSGSTGMPKGVQVTHSGLGNLAQVHMRTLGILPTSRVLQFSSLSFDASIWEVVMALLTGASLHLATQQDLLPGAGLLSLLQERAITALTIPPSALAALPVESVPALATLMVAGEACPVEVVQRWAAGRHFWNCYGPTESTVCASVAACVADGRIPSIGTSIANTQLYVLDAHLQPVPIGVPGELYIGGITLARGYLNRPELTAERFIPHPFGTQEGERLYKTGDRVRLCADGTLEFIGRLDQQVKLRGYRIELGEIENALKWHPSVREAVVVLFEDEAKDKHLVAYVVENDPTAKALSRDVLHAYLQEKLPNYMVPASIILLDVLPLTSNGKIDRKALPAPEFSQSGWREDQVVPRTLIEELLAEIWCEVLKRSSISVHDNFFESGGHSLLATQLVARLCRVFQAEIPLRCLFEAPSIAEMAERVEQILRKEAKITAPPLVRAEREQDLPLSFAQQRLWFLSQLEPESTTYLVPQALRLQGKLDASSLERSLSAVIRRHDILRTTFQLRDNQPVQVIQPASVYTLPVVDLLGLGQEEKEREALRLVTREVETPCDIATGPLLRVSLLRLAEQEHVLLLTMHHIITDGWSMSVFVRELTTLYQTFVTEQSVVLPPLPVQYADFAVWQRQWLQGEVLEQQLAYWRQQLAGITPLELPIDHPRPAVMTSRGALQSYTVPATLHKELVSLSQREGATLFMLLLTAFQILLAHHSGQDDISVGTPIANRTQTELEELIGFFVNTLVLRTNLSGNPPFVEALRRVREVALGAYMHQDVPFEYLVEALQPERDMSRSPLFQVMFNMYQANEAIQGAQELQISELTTGRTVAKFDLTMHIVSSVHGLHCSIEYNTDLFEESTIQRLLLHWQNLLAGIVAEPQTPLIDLPLLSESEMHWLLIEQNATGAAFPADLCVHELFEQQALRTPDSIAVVCEDECLSYSALNRSADLLAAHLWHLGVRPGELIGLCVERSHEMLIGLLGILKAGCAYVPLDPAYPRERVAFMLEDSQVRVVVTQAPLLDRLPSAIAHLVTLPLDEDLDGVCISTPREALATGQLAYTIYTSGSTGLPKGVQIPHRALTNFLYAMRAPVPLEGRDRLLAVTTISFDIAGLELYLPLMSGATVVLADRVTISDGERLCLRLQEEHVTVMQATPATWRLLLASGWQGDDVLRLLCGGEALTPELASQLLQRCAELWNVYGPTETTIWSTICRITEGTSPISIGRPLANTDVYILDKHLRPVPIGSRGELYIGGEGLARGYLARPELTAERFIPHPFVGTSVGTVTSSVGNARGDDIDDVSRDESGSSSAVTDRTSDKSDVINHVATGEYDHDHLLTCISATSSKPGVRLYRTGDVARYRADGFIEVLGRLDHQIKLRGYRIELGEVEAVLRQQPGVEECVVVIREDAPGDKRLVAYVVASVAEEQPQGTPAPTGDALRRALLEKLPEYMVPAIFVLLEQLPLTENGKINRRALPVPDQGRPEMENAYVPPQTLNEEILAVIWASVLGVERVGIHDNFFALGGDSMRSIQVLAQARQRGIHFSLQQLFQYQTIYKLSQVLVEEERNRFQIDQVQPGSLIAPEDWQKLPGDVEDAYPLARLQIGMLFHSQYDPTSAVYNDIMSYHLQAPLDVQCMQAVLQYMVACHPILRTSFDLSNFSEPIQLVHRSVEVPLSVEDLRGYEHEEQEACLDAWIEEVKRRHPFDWTQAPLLRVHIHLRSEQSFQFTLNCHHAILDGWSIAALLTELFKLYFARLEGKELPGGGPLGTQFRDFVAIEQKLLASAEAQGYWTQVLDGSTKLTLPRWPKAERETAHTASPVRHVAIAPEVSENLNRLARELAVPIKSVLLAAHIKVLGVLSGEKDILAGLVCNGRPETPDGERLLGVFVNTLPLRMKLAGGTWIDLIKECFAAECEMLPYRWYPLSEVQKQQGEHELFETYFDFMRFHVYKDLSEEKNLEALDFKGFAISNFVLAANFTQDLFSSQLNLSVTCSLSELQPEQVELIAGYYTSALYAIAHEPHRCYDQCSLLSTKERQHILVEQNATTAAYPIDKCLHTYIEEQAARTPDSIALVCEGEQLTYGEFDRRANQLARHVQRLGVGPESVVGVCMPRSIDMVVGLLGIFKAGGAYLPMDPAYPQERLSFMLTDAHVAVVLTLQPTHEWLPSYQGQVVYLDSDWQTLGQEEPTAPACQAMADHLAYVIYTSGSTGQPKGAMVTQRGMLNHLFAKVQALDLTADDIVAQTASHCFDISVWQFFAALLQGGQVYIYPDEVAHDPLQLFECVARESVSILEIVPSLLRAYLDAIELLSEPVRGGEHLRWLVVTGELFPSSLGRRWLQHCPQVSLLNAYGPTECSDDVTHAVLNQALLERGATAPIGLPIDNTQIYLLDHALQPVPVGVPGQIYVGGLGVGRGYVGDAVRTAAAFIPDPFGAPGGRLYKTGDVGRYHPDGQIEFIERVDHQVKVRGYRIELGEIETVLGRHPAVRQNLVLVREDEPGQQRLVAYVVARDADAAPSWEQLRNYLLERLPHYVIPQAFVLLDAFPLTANGKINRRALPMPESLYDAGGVELVAARTPIEELLVGIWCEVLERSQVSVRDNFFELGGDSLLAIRLVSRVQSKLQVQLSVRSLFEAPTIAGLAQQIEQSLRKGQNVELPPLRAVARQQAMPLSFSQQRLWFLDQLEPDSVAYLIPSVRRFQGALHVRALERGLEEIIRRHESLRTTFQIHDGQPVQIIHPATPLSLPVIDLTRLAAEIRESEAKRLIEQEANHPCDLTQGPVLRVFLARLHCDEHALLWTIHHIVSDRWSMRVFEREMTTLYQAFVSGHPAPLSPLPLQYADFAFWQRQWLQGEVLETQLDYWIEQLSGAPILELPVDHPHPPVRSQHGATHAFILSGELSQALMTLSQQEAVTLFMVLLAAFQILLYRYTDQKDIVLGTNSANRNRVEVEGIIGFFVNLLALRTKLGGKMSFREVLQRVREGVLGAYAHQETPFELVVEKLVPTRTLERMPLVQALFVLQNFSPLQSPSQEATDFTEQDMILDPLKAEANTARFDLALFMGEHAGQLYGVFNYSLDLFEACTMATMAARFKTLLQSIVRNADEAIDRLEFLTEQERWQSEQEIKALKSTLRLRRGERFTFPG